MDGLLHEILEMPDRARECYERNKNVVLPRGVPYLGMGSSYFAPLTAYYAGADIEPEIASEYYHYRGSETLPLGVLISQSGETSETNWNLKKFEEVIAITNNNKSKLAKSSQNVIELNAGKEENFSSTKTYFNTLITLYAGLKINPQKAVVFVNEHFGELRKEAETLATLFVKSLADKKPKGFYIVGEGPNLGTAYEAALILSETTKLPWIGLSAGQYDHGPKETAKNSVVLMINGGGKSVKRIEYLKKLLNDKTDSLVIEFKEESISETLSPFTMSVRFCFFMNYLADHLKIEKTFHLGNKITTVPDSLR